MRTRLNNAAGAAKRMANVRADNLIGDIRILISSMQEAALKAITPMKNELRALVQAFTETISSVGRYLERNSGLVTGFVAATAAAGAFGLALVAIGTAAQVAAAAVGGLQLIISPLTKLGLSIATVSKYWMLLVDNIVIAISAVLTPLGATIGVVVAAVAALGYGLVQLQKHFGVFNPFFDAVKTIVAKVRDELIPVVASIRDIFLNEIGPVVVQAASAIMEAFSPIMHLFNEVFGTIGMGLLEQFATGIKVAANVLKSVFLTAIEIVKAELEILLGAFELGLQAAENAGVIVSRAERDRGKKLDQQLKEINERRSAKAEGGKENPGAKPLLKNVGGVIKDPEAEKRRIEEQALLDSLKSFADSIHRSNLTSQEKFRATMEKLQQAKAAGYLTDDDFNRETAKQRQTLQDEFARQEEERQRRLEEISNRNRDRMLDEINSRADLARANDDFIGEMKALGQGAMEARKAGFIELASDLARQQLEALTSRAVGLEQQYADSLMNADFQTASAQEAIFGIGQQTVDQQALDEAKAARRAAEKTNDLLQRIARDLEE